MLRFLIFFMMAQSFAVWGQTNVSVNGSKLTIQQITLLQAGYGISIQAGSYWYDAYSGAWGLMGGPTAGFILPGLEVGNSMPANASHGNTGVFINGRELPQADLMALQQLLGPVNPGRYWVDAFGNAGLEGGPALLNLRRLAQQQNTHLYRNSYTGIGAGSSGGTSYVMGKDWSVTVDH